MKKRTYVLFIFSLVLFSCACGQKKGNVIHYDQGECMLINGIDEFEIIKTKGDVGKMNAMFNTTSTYPETLMKFIFVMRKRGFI